MYCAHCGGYVDQDAEFCPVCGNALYTPEGYSYIVDAPPNLPPRSMGMAPAQTSQPKPRPRTPIVIASIVAGLLLISSAAFGITIMLGNNAGPGTTETTSTSEQGGSNESSEPITIAAKDSSEEDTDSEESTQQSDEEDEDAGEVAEPISVDDNEPVFNDPDTCGTDQYVMPDSSTYEYTRDQLEALTHKQLFYGRNEILCRYGRECRDTRLKTFFASRAWFKNLPRRYSADEWDVLYPNDVTTPLTSVEKRNYELIFAVEEEKWNSGDRS